MTKQIDKWSIIVMAITLILFLLALFITGSTHDLLLETGVFLVSVKLILMSYKIGAQVEDLKNRLTHIQQAIQRSEHLPPPR